MSAFILGLSTLLQFTAAVLSVRLIQVTGRWKAWSFIAIAMMLMGVRRSITFYKTITNDGVQSADLTTELVALSISILMVIGVLLIGPIFRKIKSTNTALQQSEERFRNLYDDNPLMLFSISEDGTVLSVNKYGAEHLGFSKEQLIGKSVLNIFNDEDKPLAQEILKQCFAEPDELHRWELRKVHHDGTVMWVHETARTVFHVNGKPMVLIVCEDITESKQTEAELKKSEERFSLAMEAANVGLWDWNLLTDEVYYSPRWKSMLGYTENEIEGHLSSWRELVHPDDIDSALSSIQAFLNNETDKFEFDFRMRHKNGNYINILAHAFAVGNEDERITRLVGTHVDITERKKAEEQLNYHSSHDSLTGLVNRREFERRVVRLIQSSKEHSQKNALCYMDLDQFKVINDTCGHAAGDEMLRQISTVLQAVIRNRDTLARLGGDEFGVLMEHCSIDDAHRVTTSIQKAIQDFNFTWEGRSFRLGVSIGLVPITDTISNLTQLLKDADAACYMAKDKGRNRIHVHRDEDSELAQRHGEMQWVTRIQQALDEERFCLYAQAIESLDKRTEKHYELLIRMLDDQGEIVPPGAFLPAAERYNLITQLDRWVIEKTFRLLKENPAFLEQVNFISINLSGQSLTDEAFLDFTIKQLQNFGNNGAKICFEITETAAISNLMLADRFIAELRAFECRFALDDFGSGLSSFGYLKHLPVDFLKIDGMFVKDIVDDPIDHAMVKSINEIGQVVGMQTIAEFVENDEIKGMLREIGVNYAQGYGIHKPQPFDELLNHSDNVTDINKSKDGEEYDS